MITPKEAAARISANLKRILAERGWTVLKLAERANEPQNSVYRTVRGENEPGAALLCSLADALGVSADSLLEIPKKRRNSA